MQIPFLSRNKLVVGIDIGSHSVKICQLKKNGSRYSLLSLGTALLPEGAVDDGILNEPSLVGEIVKNLLQNLRIRNKKIGFSISGYSVIVKKIVLDAMEDALLEEHILAEAEQYIPFDQDDVYLDFQDLKTNTDPQDRTDIMLVAAKKEVVQDYLFMFEEQGLTPVLVDVDGFAFENAFEHAHPNEKDVALVNIGATTMNINLISNGISVVARDIALGSQQLTEKIQDNLGIEFKEAEDIKLGISPAGKSQEQIREIFNSTCSYWVLEIKKSIDLYHANHQDRPLQKIVLAGGGAKVSGFADFLSQETGIDVKIFSPFKGIDIDEKNIDPDYLASIGPEMAIATGIALRESVI
ncbi:type IV pilus biogenesis protein PilM [Desulfotalea psychrophila]|nr:type IV pilus assembly protein PilM [Desulfotalea psychrophila]